MKKLLLLAAVAASMSVANAEDFGTYFALTSDGEAISNGQTVTIAGYYDPVAKDNPEVLDIPGYTPFQGYKADAIIIATNIYDEAMDLAFTIKRIEPSIESVPSYTNGVGGIGYFQICYNDQCNNADDHSKSFSLDPEGGKVDFDIHHAGFMDLIPATLKLDLCVMEGGDKIEGTDCTVYVSFTNEKDITAAVDGIQAEDGAEEYYNLQGFRVAEPEKGGIYLVRKGSKVTKRLF
ncbi:MAG: hypothetical protein Q4C37_00325 [Bacteroidales bacterium]|nr:hypothetical protein [Bacteroidales bacterium]